MKLFMKQKFFSLKDRFTIVDSNGLDVFFVEGKLFSLSNELHIYDRYEEEVAFIKKRLMTFLDKFEVCVSGVLFAEIVKEYTFFKPSYRIDSCNWTVSGDLSAYDYEINEGINKIASISKAWFSWNDSFEIDIFDDKNIVLVIAIVLAIDCVLDNRRK